MKGLNRAFTAALLLFFSTEALAETCDAVDAEAQRLLASPAQRSDLIALKHIARRAMANSGCRGEYVYRLARDLTLAALEDLEKKAAAEGRPLASRELQTLSEISRPWQLMTALGDAHFAERAWLRAFDAYDIALGNLDMAKGDERRLYGDVYARAIVARAILENETANDRSMSRPTAPQFRTFRGGPAVDRAFLDDALWNRVGLSADRRLLQAYLVEFPDGAHAAMAKTRLTELAK